MVELVRIDICCEFSMKYFHFALPREGHLSQVFYIFAYLKKHHNSALVFYLSYPDVNIDTFPNHDWKIFYGVSKKLCPLICQTLLERRWKCIVLWMLIMLERSKHVVLFLVSLSSCRWHPYITVQSVRIQSRPLLSDQSLWL